jgi:hypothetical protein
MKGFKPAKNIVLIETFGFLLVIMAIWVDEAFHLPHHLFGEPLVPFLVREAIWESAFVGILGFTVIFFTWRSAKRIAQLESLLPICMICKKIRKPDADPKLDESWETVERYINERTGSQFSHGLCPECALSKYGIRVGSGGEKS